MQVHTLQEGMITIKEAHLSHTPEMATAEVHQNGILTVGGPLKETHTAEAHLRETPIPETPMQGTPTSTEPHTLDQLTPMLAEVTTLQGTDLLQGIITEGLHSHLSSKTHIGQLMVHTPSDPHGRPLSKSLLKVPGQSTAAIRMHSYKETLDIIDSLWVPWLLELLICYLTSGQKLSS